MDISYIGYKLSLTKILPSSVLFQSKLLDGITKHGKHFHLDIHNNTKRIPPSTQKRNGSYGTNLNIQTLQARGGKIRKLVGPTEKSGDPQNTDSKSNLKKRDKMSVPSNVLPYQMHPPCSPASFPVTPLNPVPYPCRDCARFHRSIDRERSPVR